MKSFLLLIWNWDSGSDYVFGKNAPLLVILHLFHTEVNIICGNKSNGVFPLYVDDTIIYSSPPSGVQTL